MTQFHRQPVMAPVDFSGSSLHAARVARAIAESDQHLTLVHVSLDFDLVVPSHNWVSGVPVDTDQERLERLRVWRDDNDLGDVSMAVRSGDPGTEVCKLADEQQTQLIVIASHGRHGLKRFLLGSVAERIIRHCHCSVLVLHRDDDQPVSDVGAADWLPRKKILVPIDFSESSSQAIDAALEVAESPSDIEVVNVIAPLDDPVLIGSVVMTDETHLAGRQEHLERYLKEHGYGAVQARAFLGDPGTVIVERAAEVETDLIVIPSHGYRGLQRLVLGSTTERVVRHAAAPVLILRRPDAEA